MPILSGKLNFLSKVLAKPASILSQTGFKFVSMVSGFAQGHMFHKRDTSSNGTTTAKYTQIGNSHTMAPGGYWYSGTLTMAKYNDDRVFWTNSALPYFTVSERNSTTNTWTNTPLTVSSGTYFPASTTTNYKRISIHPSGNFVVLVNYATNGTAVLFGYDNTTKTLTPLNTSIGGVPRVNCVAWNSDGTKLAIGSSLSSPYIYIYSFDSVSGTFTALSTVNTALAAAPTDISWNGTNIVAVSCNNTTTPFLVYDCSSGTPTALTNPTFQALAPSFVSWNPAGTMLVVGGANATLSYYNYSSGTLTKGANTISSSTSSGRQIYPSWSSDGTKFSTSTDAGYNSGGFSLWTVSGETFTNTGTSNPARGSGGASPAYTYSYNYGSFYSNDGTRFYILTSPVGVLEYTLSGSTWSLSNTMVYPALRASATQYQPACSSFSPNGSYLAINSRSGFYLNIYTISGDTLSLGTISGTTPSNYYYNIRWASDSSAFVVGTGNSNVFIYTVSGSTATYRQTLTPGLAGNDIQWLSNTHFVLIGHTTSQNITVYSWNSSTNTASIAAQINQTSSPVTGDWLDSGTLIVGNTAGITPVAFTGGNTLTLGTQVSNACYGLRISPDKNYMVTTFGTTLRVYKISGTGTSTTFTQVYTTTMTGYPNSQTIKWSNDSTTFAIIPRESSGNTQPIAQFGHSGDTFIKQNSPQWNSDQYGYQFQGGTTYSTNTPNTHDLWDDGSTTTVIG